MSFFARSLIFYCYLDYALIWWKGVDSLRPLSLDWLCFLFGLTAFTITVLVDFPRVLVDLSLAVSETLWLEGGRQGCWNR